MAVAAVRSFEELREECLQKGELWEDPDFPATQASVFYHQTPPFTFEWKRPNVSVECRENLTHARSASRSTTFTLPFVSAGIHRGAGVHLVRLPDRAGKTG